jgi:hypothetical protein
MNLALAPIGGISDLRMVVFDYLSSISISLNFVFKFGQLYENYIFSYKFLLLGR